MSAAVPELITDAGASFGDGAFQPGEHVTIHGVNNLEEGLRGKIIAWAPADALYVVKDANAGTWGLRGEKLRPMATLELDPGGAWTEVPLGVAVPGGAELRMDLGAGGKRYARLLPAVAAATAPGAKSCAAAAVLPRMEFRSVGPLAVSRVCLGTMQFAAFPGHPAPAQSVVTATVRAALDSGINFFDCAECYGADHAAHKSFGAALREIGVDRASVVIASKFGRHVPLWATQSPTGDPTVYDGAMVTAAIEATLAALGTEYIDLMQVHWPGNAGILGGTKYMEAHPELRENVRSVVAALAAAVEKGRVRHVGVCNFGCDDLDEWARAGGGGGGEGGGKSAGGSAGGSACGSGSGSGSDSGSGSGNSGLALVSNQLPYNPLWRAVERAVLPRCKEQGIAVLCYSSLQQGLLAGHARTASDVPLGKRRTRLYGPDSWSPEQCRHDDPEMGAAAEAEIFGRNEKGEGKGEGKGGETGTDESSRGGVLEAMRAVCAYTEHGVAEVSLAWLLSREGVTCVLAGATTPAQAARNARMPRVPGEMLVRFTEATEALKELQGGQVDQYAKESRIH